MRTFTAENMALRERAAASGERRERVLRPRLGAAALDALRRADGERNRRHVDRGVLDKSSRNYDFASAAQPTSTRKNSKSALRRQHSVPRVLDAASRPARAFRTRRPRRYRSTVRATPRPPSPARAACPRSFVPPPPPNRPSRASVARRVPPRSALARATHRPRARRTTLRLERDA